VFLENSLNKIFSLNQNDLNFTNIKKVLTIDDSGKEKVFFSLLKKNSQIVSLYREKIITPSDASDFFYYCRFLCQAIIDSKNKDEYARKIPVYLFREKVFMINLYMKYSSEKKKRLLNLLSSTEKLLRRGVDLKLVLGLRFLLNIKKITIS